MLSPKTQMNLRNAKAYFREHLCVGDYYAEGQKVAGRWFGEGATKLGLGGKVGEQDFVRLCEGLHPATGERLTLRRNGQRLENGANVANRRVFFDFTISPPKSVSVVALMQDDRISAVHDAAVRDAMAELEKLAATRVRKGGAQGERLTRNLIGAAFRHETSRECDPHLHTHCVVLNATFDPVEQRWKALETVQMLRAQKLAENVYFHELAKGLRKLGYALESSARNFEIKGVPVSVLERFSKRHHEIERETARRLARGEVRGNVQDAREQIAREIRKRKPAATSAERLRGDWEWQMTREERHALAHLPRAKAAAGAALNAGELVAWADEHLFERRAVVEEFELLTAALGRGRGEAVNVTELRAAIAQRGYVRADQGQALTSPAVLRSELAVVFAARDGRGACSPLAPDFAPSPKLSAEQEKAVRHLLGSRDAVLIFRGGAGTGKSFALQEVHRGLVAAGRPVVVAAPQRQQVQDLVADGLPAQTLAHLLASRQVPLGAVVIVDEAGQVGARQMHELITLARNANARLLLSGDTRQHGAVAASDALRAIEAYSGIRPAEIATIRRQDPTRGRTLPERVTIARYRAAVKAAAAGDVSGSVARLDALGCVREHPEADRRGILAAEYLAAAERRESVLVVAQTWNEVRGVNEAIRERLRSAGKLGSDTPVVADQPVDTTIAERRDPRTYAGRDAVVFVRRYGRFTQGDRAEVRGTTAHGVVLRKDGRDSVVGFRYVDRFALAQSVQLDLAHGDRLQLKFNGRSAEGAPLANGELVTVQQVHPDGRIAVTGARGELKTLTPAQRLFHRGYAVTSYASQGKTVDTVLFSDAGNRAATNRQQWYVTISRGRKRVVIFTPDKAALKAHAARVGDRPLAVDLKSAPAALARGSPWMRHAWATIQQLHRAQFLASRRTVTAQRGIRPTL